MVPRISAYGYRVHTVKRHAIIPIFIPHLGCPEKCVFCDQVAITARRANVTEEEVRETVERYLSTLGDLNSSDIEIAFYGGSFTGINPALQERYLGIAKEYVDKGLVSGIHLSTRPDYIDREVLERLKAYGVKAIELGVQSFDDKVLSLSKRGHDSSSVYRACELIKDYGFTLGIQLMIGLPGDSDESLRFSANETVRLKPQLARLYPTVVLPGTELKEMAESGIYKPLSLEEAVTKTAMMYRILSDAGILIMRVGLKSTDIISDSSFGDEKSGSYHPAFRELVEGEIAREKIEALLEEALHNYGEGLKPPCHTLLTIYSNPAWLSQAAGHKGENRKYFKERFPNIELKFSGDDSLQPGEFNIN